MLSITSERKNLKNGEKSKRIYGVGTTLVLIQDRNGRFVTAYVMVDGQGTWDLGCGGCATLGKLRRIFHVFNNRNKRPYQAA